MNDLVISHDDPKKMGEFRKVVEKSMEEESGVEDSIFAHFYPEPNYEEEEVDKKSIMPAWWNWRVANWGTKCSEGYTEVRENEGNTMHLSFETAWSPPSGVIQKMVEQGFSTELWYMEQGFDFWGYELDGKVIHEGSPSEYLVDDWGNSLQEWTELPEGAKGKGKKIEKTREQRINFESEKLPFSMRTVTYHIWEHDWWDTAKPRKKKALELGISEEIWNKCALFETRGG